MHRKTKKLVLEAKSFAGICDKDASGSEKKKGTLSAKRLEWETLLQVLQQGSSEDGETADLAWRWDTGRKLFLSGKQNKSANCVKTGDIAGLSEWIHSALLARKHLPAPPDSIRFMTWNIGIGPSRKEDETNEAWSCDDFDYAVADSGNSIGDDGHDIIFLQEVPVPRQGTKGATVQGNQNTSGWVDLDWLTQHFAEKYHIITSRRRLDMNRIGYVLVTLLSKSTFGSNAAFYAVDVRLQTSTSNSWPCALIVVSENTNQYFANLHLLSRCLRQSEEIRRRQCAAIAAFIPKDANILMGGDFNACGTEATALLQAINPNLTFLENRHTWTYRKFETHRTDLQVFDYLAVSASHKALITSGSSTIFNRPYLSKADKHQHLPVSNVLQQHLITRFSKPSCKLCAENPLVVASATNATQVSGHAMGQIGFSLKNTPTRDGRYITTWPKTGSALQDALIKKVAGGSTKFCLQLLPWSSIQKSAVGSKLPSTVVKDSSWEHL